jgi:hypothetical protein
MASANRIPDLFQVMANELARARANKTFPPTTAPSTDVQATAHDYELLLQLQSIRMSTASASESYDHLLVEITRRINDRDDAYNHEANRDEAIRRVESYLRSVEHEREHFESIRSSASSVASPSTPASVVSPCSGGCSAAEVNEDVLSIYEQAAEQALSDVARPLLEGLEQYAELHEEQQGLSNEQKALHHQQVALVAEQGAMIEEHFASQRELVFNQNKTLARLEDSAHRLVALQHTLNVAVGVTNQLSQTVENLPDAIQQIVNSAVQEQTRLAVSNIANAYQVAINELEDRKLNHFREMMGSQGEVGYCPGYASIGCDSDDCRREKHRLSRTGNKTGSRLSARKLKHAARRVLRI